jgi:hypothetical protein
MRRPSGRGALGSKDKDIGGALLDRCHRHDVVAARRA